MFAKNLIFPCLLDIYGPLLTDRKRELLDYYYDEDYSLSEISELTGISRQGIRDSIKKSESELVELESKLRLYEKKSAATSAISEAHKLIDEALTKGTALTEKDVLTALKARLSAIEECL